MWTDVFEDPFVKRLVNVKGLYGWCSVWLCFFSPFVFIFLQTCSPSTKNGNTVTGFKLHVFHRLKRKKKKWLGLDEGDFQVVQCGILERHIWKKQKTTKSDWKKEIGKVSTVFHSADSDDSVFPSLSDSGGSSGACVYRARRRLCFLSVKRHPAEALKCSYFRRHESVTASYHSLPRASSVTRSVYKALWTNNALIVRVWKRNLCSSIKSSNYANAGQILDIKFDGSVFSQCC